MKNAPRATVVVVILGVAAVVLYAVFAAVQILVLNPLAAVPGASLESIYGEMAAAGETGFPTMTLLDLGAGCVLAVLVGVAVLRARLIPEGALMMFLAVLVGGAPAYFFASFGIGMSLADTFAISGGDHSPWSSVLYGVSLLSLVAVVVLAVARVVRDRSRPEPVTAQ